MSDDDRVFSGWWRRVVAALVDGVLTTALASLLLWPFGFPFEEYWSEGPLLVASRAVDLTFVLVEAAVAVVYYTPLMLAWEGRTLGKRALGIRVVRADGRRLDAGTILLRQVLLQYLLLALTPLIATLNYLLPLVDEQKRAGHDHVARTRVVRDRPLEDRDL